MTDLENAIARLELRAEQLIIHLRSMQRNAPGAEHIRSVLLVMLLRLVALKGRRDRLEDGLKLDQAAARSMHRREKIDPICALD